MPTINGAHLIIYSTNAEADREFFRDVLSLDSVDVGGGWLIFGLPPAELAVHPSENNDVHECYLMCDDIESFMAEMGQHNIACEPVQDQGWGLVSKLILPGGGKLPVYQPRHARPAPPAGDGVPAKGAKKRPATRARPKPARAANKGKTTTKARTSAKATKKKPPAKKRKR